ncbi:MAG: terminase small subunit [Verrucomicrobiota bacterium]
MIATAEMINGSLNPRQQKFVELYVSGVPAGRAYEQAGYAPRGNAAEAEASRMVRNPKVAQAIQHERNESKRNALLTRDAKLTILAEIALNVTAPGRERIAAIKLHNDMTGENTPQPKAAGQSDTWLHDVRERAKHMVSSLCRTMDDDRKPWMDRNESKQEEDGTIKP